MPRSLTFVLPALLMLSACTDNSATLISSDRIAQFKSGTSNQTEVIATLGKPVHTISEADGSKIDQYPTEAGASGGGFVPAWLGGGAPTRYGMVSFTYGAGGVLKDVSTTK
ncbi:MAG: hypothetical protein JWM91_3831 [Rhodospirillales bacterium]|nr:hypothetical protein [Rhodospirillales bacterium]